MGKGAGKRKRQEQLKGSGKIRNSDNDKSKVSSSSDDEWGGYPDNDKSKAGYSDNDKSKASSSSDDEWAGYSDNDKNVGELRDYTPTGTSLHVEGVLQMPPADNQGKQSIELRVVRVLDCGKCDAGKYPLPKTKLTLGRLRDHVHLRPRTNIISAIARIRNELAFATHTFFRDNGFLYVQTPIITTSDCEGAGEMFQVTTLINDAEKLEKELIKNPPPSQEDVDVAKNVVKDKGEIVAKLKADKAGKPAITAAVAELNKAKESLSKTEERFNQKPGLPKKDGKIDYGQDFFARQAFLTVSGQLQAETYACALSSVYTFGPTFRAEHSHTSRHLAEFWS
ncbi:class II aminoacyl-tRNA and biotin synthetases superfamily protein [Artemisia annua]|uniref:Class II aminoacyl-tRNA and biotin synthetases superfamily protein n=1 Tax=Artemisia annua TaxID=35608 RepID=A0A2U1P1X9_ARTAN|nr:class II aminoacyl-tRNA and biotin synthetases superfamily protein [Artemisia annua]